MDGDASAGLQAAYFERREALLRYFHARTGSAADAEDLYQDLYLKVRAAPESEVVSPGAYLFKLAFHLMLDRSRQQRRSMSRDAAYRDVNVERIGGEDRADDPGAEQALVARQRLDRLMARLERMPAKVREAFRIHKFEGFNQAETAQKMGVSKSSIERWLSDALKSLAEDDR